MKKNHSPSTNATKKYSSLNLNTVYKPNGSNRPGQNGRMLLGTVKKGVVKKAPPPTAPKPLNLPSVKKENAGYDPKIALVPASGSTWSGPDASANPSGPEAPAPIPMSQANGPVSTTVPPTAPPPGPETSPPPSSRQPPDKSVAWGGRGMSKPAPNTAPAPPPQMMPIRPTEDLNRWVGGSSGGRFGGRPGGSSASTGFGGSNLQARMRGSKPVEAWPTLAPKEEEAASADSPTANGHSAPKESFALLESKEGDDAWADVDDEMTYDDADNLFDDKKPDSAKPHQEDRVLSAEEKRALQIAQMEIDERRREQEMQAQQVEEMKREEADAADAVRQAAKRQAEERQEAEAAARRKEELKKEEEEREAANNGQSVQEQFKEQALKARERRAREEEEANNERKARADAKLQELEQKKAERVREREAVEEEARAARSKKQQDLVEQEQRKWQTNNNVWSAPERQGPAEDDSHDSRGSREESWRKTTDQSDDSAQPSSILKRETSRRTLWAPAQDAGGDDKSKSPRGESRPGRGEPREKTDEQRQKEFYNKKFEKLSDQGDWREKKKDEQAKVKADQKLKREQRDKERNSKKADAKPESKAKGEESWRKKPDEKKKEESQAKPRAEARKKEGGGAQISLPAPKPKEEGDETEPKSPSVPSPDADADADAEAIFKVPTDSWAYMKIRKWCEHNGVFKWCEQKKIPGSKNSDNKELLLDKVRMWQEALAKGEVEPAEKSKRARGSRQRKERDGKKDGAGRSEDPKDEDADDDGKKRGNRARGGARRNRRDDETDGKGKRRGSVDAKSEEPKTPPKPPSAALPLDNQMGLQEIAGGLRVASEGGMVVVESNETCEDDSGFTTEIKKKDKKDARKEANAQQDREVKARRRTEEKENRKARQEAERTKKAAAAAAEKASAAAKAEEAKSAPPAPNLPQPMAQSIMQDLAGAAPVAGAVPAKPAWGGKGSNKTESSNFHDIMLEAKFKQAPPTARLVQPDSPQNFEVPAPHPPNVANSASGAIGGERKMPADVPAADPWGNTATPPPASFPQAAFGGGAFSQSPFSVDPQLHTGPFQTLTQTQGVAPPAAQFTALPSFSASGHYGNAFSAGASGLGGWGGSDGAFSAGGAQNQLPAEALSTGGHHPSGWSPQPNQKTVGPNNKSDGANGSAPNAKPNGGGEKNKRNSRGGKGRGGKGRDGGKGKGAGKGQDSKDGDSGKADQGRNNNRGGRQNRRGGKADGGKGGNSHKSGDASASAPTVDAVVPNKSRRGGRNAKKSTAKAPE